MGNPLTKAEIKTFFVLFSAAYIVHKWMAIRAIAINAPQLASFLSIAGDIFLACILVMIFKNIEVKNEQNNRKSKRH